MFLNAGKIHLSFPLLRLYYVVFNYFSAVAGRAFHQSVSYALLLCSGAAGQLVPLAHGAVAAAAAAW